jgi:hypothetical protein
VAWKSVWKNGYSFESFVDRRDELWEVFFKLIENWLQNHDFKAIVSPGLRSFGLTLAQSSSGMDWAV